MNVIRIARLIAIALMLIFFTMAKGHAQVGRLKKAAQQAATGAAGNAVAPATAGPQASKNANVVEITDAVLTAALGIAAIDEKLRLLEMQRGAMQIRDDSVYDAWEACHAGVRASLDSDIQALGARVKNAQAAGDLNLVMLLADSVRIYGMKVASDGAAKCGSEPSRSTYTDQTTPLADERALLLSGAGLNTLSLAVVRERVIPLCRSALNGGNLPITQVPGDAPHFYVYSAAESAAIAPRCSPLLAAFQAAP